MSSSASAIEPDTDTGAEEDDSNYDSGSGSSYATSLVTAAKDHTFENGRRYNGYSNKHYFPNDEQQQNTMDMLHHTFGLLRKGRLHDAPIGPKPQRILDLGTGTGINAIDLGDAYPSAQIIGNDLSPIQPAWVPPNVEFEVDDFNKEWSHKPNSFDLIIARCLFGSVPDWVKLFKEAHKALKPGGYLETADHGIMPLNDDNTLPPDSELLKAGKAFLDAGAKLGNEMEPHHHTEKWMKEAGFVDVTVKNYILPANSWPKDKRLKEVGRFFLASMSEGMPGFVYHVYSNVYGWDKAEIDEKVGKILTDMKNRAIHNYYPFRVVYGRKAEEDK